MDNLMYFEQLQEKYQKYFDVERNINIVNEKIDLYARFRLVNNRTFITKNDIMESFENNEHCLVKNYEIVELSDIKLFSDFLNKTMETLIVPGRNHMSTYITGVAITNNEVSEDVEKWIQNYKKSKAYKFYFHGWSEIRLVLVDLKKRRVITNKAASSVKKVYEITPLNK